MIDLYKISKRIWECWNNYYSSNWIYDRSLFGKLRNHKPLFIPVMVCCHLMYYNLASFLVTPQYITIYYHSGESKCINGRNTHIYLAISFESLKLWMYHQANTLSLKRESLYNAFMISIIYPYCMITMSILWNLFRIWGYCVAMSGCAPFWLAIQV